MPTAAIQSAMKTTRTSSIPYFSARPAPQRAFSTSGSNDSLASGDSCQSWISHMSLDSRGSRRGRKRFTRTSVVNVDRYVDEKYVSHKLQPDMDRMSNLVLPEPHHFMSAPIPLRNHTRADPVTSMNREDKSTGPLAPAIYCTWPSCNLRFRYRFDWARHEEAVHYCPFNWVCCGDGSDHATQLEDCYICDPTFADVLARRSARATHQEGSQDPQRPEAFYT
jgi:hypothetical protein